MLSVLTSVLPSVTHSCFSEGGQVAALLSVEDLSRCLFTVTSAALTSSFTFRFTVAPCLAAVCRSEHHDRRSDTVTVLIIKEATFSPYTVGSTLFWQSDFSLFFIHPSIFYTCLFLRKIIRSAGRIRMFLFRCSILKIVD